MGTFGNYIIINDGIFYVFYNHFDSCDLEYNIIEDLKKLRSEDFQAIKDSLTRIQSYDDYITLCKQEGSPDQSIHFDEILSAGLHPEKYTIDAIIKDEDELYEYAWNYWTVFIDFDQYRVIVDGKKIIENIREITQK